MLSPESELLARFTEELRYLRSMSARFHRQHADVAAGLELGAGVTPDPHVERLIESFALLTARIRSDLHDDFPEIAGELLRILYPHFVNPLPSMTIVRFEPGEKHSTVPARKKVFGSTAEGEVCWFETCYDTAVWPVRVREVKGTQHVSDFAGTPAAERENPSGTVLRLALETLGGATFEALDIDTLRVFVNNDALIRALYPLLLEGDCRRVAVLDPASGRLSADCIEVAPVGFGKDEQVLYYESGAHPAYRILQEYFAFERKFHFFDVKGLRGRLSGKAVNLLIFLHDALPNPALLHRDAFVLNCTPAVNLFRHVSEPIRVHQRDFEYELVADYRARSTVIHSIESVSGSSDRRQTLREYAPFYSFTHHAQTQSALWHARREGDAMYLSFFDADFNPAVPGDEIVYAHVRCTNGELAHRLEAGAPLQSDEDLSVNGIVTLTKPTAPVPAPFGGERLWRLVSHLSLNYLSMESDGDALLALREILMLYCPEGMPLLRRRIQGIQWMKARKVMRRVDVWQDFAFVRGTEVTLHFDDALMNDNYLLFTLVLSHFLALHASLNSFLQLVITSDHEGKGYRCPMMIGGRPVL